MKLNEEIRLLYLFMIQFVSFFIFISCVCMCLFVFPLELKLSEQRGLEKQCIEFAKYMLQETVRH